jgi:hypothetical protein
MVEMLCPAGHRKEAEGKESVHPLSHKAVRKQSWPERWD